MTEGEEWDPQPVDLREGERRDDELSAHARRNLEQLRIAERELSQEREEE